VSLLLALGPAPFALMAAAPPMHVPLRFADVNYGGELWTRYAAATCNLLTRPDRVRVDRDGRVMAEDAAGVHQAPLVPIGSDWLSPDVHDPHRLRILFHARRP